MEGETPQQQWPPASSSVPDAGASWHRALQRSRSWRASGRAVTPLPSPSLPGPALRWASLRLASLPFQGPAGGGTRAPSQPGRRGRSPRGARAGGAGALGAHGLGTGAHGRGSARGGWRLPGAPRPGPAMPTRTPGPGRAESPGGGNPTRGKSGGGARSPAPAACPRGRNPVARPLRRAGKLRLEGFGLLLLWRGGRRPWASVYPLTAKGPWV